MGGTLYYALSDNLGSTGITTDSTGEQVAELRYTPWGEVRSTSGTTPTDRTYTGQRSYVASFGLMFYNARWYDPTVGRFTQADTVVSAGAQGYDRYGYTNNSPLLYSDPSGHNAISDFALGYTAEFTRVNLWFHPQAQQALSVKESESDAMVVGRIVADVVAIAVGAQEVGDGAGLAGGGTAVACGSTLCLASALPIAAGAALALQGLGTGVNAAIGIGQNAAMLGGNNDGGDGSSGRIYEPSPKHDPAGGWGSPMDLDKETAQKVLDSGIQFGKKIYSYYDGQAYVFQPTDANGVYHGYVVETRIPTSVLKTWQSQGLITGPEYNDMRSWPTKVTHWR